jgi:streptogramin lyase
VRANGRRHLNLWFAGTVRNLIGRVTTGGSITEYPVPTRRSGPRDLVSGPDGTSEVYPRRGQGVVGSAAGKLVRLIY